MEDYIDLFDLAAYHIQDGFLGNASDGHSNQQIVTGLCVFVCVLVCVFLVSNVSILHLLRTLEQAIAEMWS